MSFDSRANAAGMLRGVMEGNRAAHVWRSPQFPGADMVIKYSWPEIEVEPDAHGLPESFAKDVGLEYGGTLSRDEAARKLQNMRVAASQAESIP